MKIKVIKKHKPIHQIFDCFKCFFNSSFLDSSLKGDEGKVSIIGLYPYLSISTKDGKTMLNGKVSNASFEELLKNYLKENRMENNTSLPITSGAIGYFSYDYALKKCGYSSKHKKQLDAPDAFLNFYDVFIIENHEDNFLYIVANGKSKNEDKAIEEIEQYLKLDLDKREDQLTIDGEQERQTLEEEKYIERVKGKASFEADFEREEYIKAVEKMKHHIVEGDIYVVNMTEQFRLSSPKSPYEVFQTLRNINPSPFGAYINYDNFKVISSSPERFLYIKDKKIVTCPIKGTRKRGKTKEEDEALKKELECSEKEKSELLMVVDLERNDLNKICIPGSVTVENLFNVKTYAEVFHLVAKVEGKLKENTDIVDVLTAMFPGGSITGTPKLSAMKIIDSVEKSSRNLYTGSIGYISLDGSADLNIVIRTAIYQNGIYYVGAGGGITYESDAYFEMEEVFQKARAIFHSIQFDKE